MIKQILLSVFLIMAIFGYSQDGDSYVYGDNSSSSTRPAKQPSKDGGFNWSRVTIGGGLGLTFGDVTIIEVAPNFGYYLTDNILAGVGVNYTYYADKRTAFNTSIYGGRVYGEYLVPNMPLLAHVETELINLEWTATERKNIVNVYVGGGLKQALGGTSYVYVLGLWNLNETTESILIRQPNPTIRIGIAIGL
jgi:hypothetical protein